MTWMTNNPVATTTASVVTMARSLPKAGPLSEMAVAPLIWFHSQFTAEPAASAKSLAMSLKAESAMEPAAPPAREVRQPTGSVSEQPISRASSPPPPRRRNRRGRGPPTPGSK